MVVARNKLSKVSANGLISVHPDLEQSIGPRTVAQLWDLKLFEVEGRCHDPSPSSKRHGGE